MQLTLVRTTFTDRSTIGELSIDTEPFCATLELPDKDGLPGSCIPMGTYKVVSYASPKFGRLMPLLEGIPGRSNIEIHFGNDPDNTEGCVLVGQLSSTPDFIENSRETFNALWAKIQGPMEQGKCVITVLGGARLSNGEAVQEAAAGDN